MFAKEHQDRIAALLRIDSTRPEYTYITDDLLPEALQALYEENGIEVLKGKTTR